MNKIIVFILLNFAIFPNIANAQAIDKKCNSNVRLESDFQCLSRKDKTLVEECAEKHNIKIKNNFSVYYKPTGDNPWARMDAIKFEQDFGRLARVSVTLTRKSTNRFGEVVNNSVSCFWSGDDYQMDKSEIDLLLEKSKD